MSSGQQLQRLQRLQRLQQSAVTFGRILAFNFFKFKHLLGGKAGLILHIFVGFAVVWGIREGRINAFSKGEGGSKDNLLKQEVGEPVVGAPTSGGTNKHKMMADGGTSPITAAGNALFRLVPRDVQMWGCVFRNQAINPTSSLISWMFFYAKLPGYYNFHAFTFTSKCVQYTCAQKTCC